MFIINKSVYFVLQSTIIMTKGKTKKSRCPKNYVFSAKEIAKMVGCSISAVKQIRQGVYKSKSGLIEQVEAIDQIADDSKSLLIEEIERIVKLPTQASA